MTSEPYSLSEQIFAHENFNVLSLDDEIRVDQLCVQLLRLFCQEQIEQGMDPLRAGELARGADYFLREFAVADRCDNIFELPAGRIRQFAGNWYIVKTLEPNLSELTSILAGVEAFYCYCQAHQRIRGDVLAAVTTECRDLVYYAERIETFWQISGDGYFAWNAACPIVANQDRT